jgi:radical SAM enzyme (TIGR01210 family)
MSKRIEPAYWRVSPVNIDGLEANRLMVVLKTQGCEYARKTGGCTVCGFLNHADENIGEVEIIAQLDYILDTVDFQREEVKEIDLLTLGSFYNDNEVSAHARQALIQRIARLEGVKKVSIESRAEYITAEKLKQTKALVNGKIIDLGIGLESADDHIRNKVIKKGLTRESFENTVGKLKDTGCNLLVYLLIKPPALTEKDAIEDAVESVKYVFATAREYGVNARVAFEPVFICQNTHLETLFLTDQYRLVNLWSVVEIIIRSHHYGHLFIGLSDENLSMDRMPNSCHKCYNTIVAEIETFNKTQDISALRQLECECKREYLHKLEKELI